MEMALTVPQYTVADLNLLPVDGNRYEVLAGTLLVTPSPGSDCSALDELFSDIV